MNALIAFVALILENRFGYPKALQQSIGHPVQWMGQFIGWMDDQFNSEDDDAGTRRRAGVIMLVILLLATWFVTASLSAIFESIAIGWIFEALFALPLLASKQLGEAVKLVAERLDISLEAGRAAVSHIVGRDTANLSEAEVSRAAIETLAENASDGVIAPLFWLVLFGLPGIALYKAINTADSMVGHLNERHRDFGWASARLDDVVNWIPARLTALLFAGAAFFTQDASPEDAFEAAREDAKNHQSPNAGWPEAALAGALGFSLGGARAYKGEMLDLPEMGHGRRNLDAEDILTALTLYRHMIWLAMGAIGILALMSLIFM